METRSYDNYVNMLHLRKLSILKPEKVYRKRIRLDIIVWATIFFTIFLIHQMELIVWVYFERKLFGNFWIRTGDHLIRKDIFRSRLLTLLRFCSNIVFRKPSYNNFIKSFWINRIKNGQTDRKIKDKRHTDEEWLAVRKNKKKPSWTLHVKCQIHITHL